MFGANVMGVEMRPLTMTRGELGGVDGVTGVNTLVDTGDPTEGV